MARIIVDGRELVAGEDANLLEVLLSHDIDMPYFCWHPAMGSVGACRQCAVVGYANEEDNRGRILMSCMTPVTEGARFSVLAEPASLFREAVIENLMLNHPHDCPVCEEGGECHLQDMTVMVGHRDRRYTGLKTTFRNQYLGPFIGHEMNRCITCYRCVRFYQDYAGGDDLGAFGSRDRVFFGRAEPGLLENEFAGNLIEVCPTGVFTDKTFSKHYTRKWDLQSAPTVCQGCSLGCNTYTSERSGELRRVHNRYHHEVNGYFLCDRGRFGAHQVNSPQRIPRAGIRNAEGLYEPLPLSRALDAVRELLNGRVVGIGSPRASLEANAALRELVGADNFCNGLTAGEQAMHEVILEMLAANLPTPSMMQVEACDAVLIVGEDVTNHAPRLALSVRQAVRNLGGAMAREVGIPPWHDAAVRELAQQDRSPLVIVSPMADRLDDVATHAIRLSPGDIVAFIGEVTGALAAEAPAPAAAIAELLKNAERPLIITGTSLGSANVIRAAANLALALGAHNANTGIFLCAGEANSLGACLLDRHNRAESLPASKPDTVIVLENDVCRRFGESLLDGVENLVVLDSHDNATVSRSTLVLPAAAFAEAEGTFINNEGRMQRSMAVYQPAGEITPSYRMLSGLAGKGQSAGEVRARIAAAHPALAAITGCAPDNAFRVRGSKVARMTHRASGRTALLADVSVHEPQQPADAESALAFSMEGNQSLAPASLRAYAWAPGWNSNQSIHKFQSEVAGPDKTEVPGLKLFRGGKPPAAFDLQEEAPVSLIGQHHIFGSDELSCLAAELASLIPGLYLRMNGATAESLGVAHGDGLALGDVAFTVLVDESVAGECAVYPVIPAAAGVAGATLSGFSRIAGYKPPPDPLRPDLITTDRVN